MGHVFKSIGHFFEKALPEIAPLIVGAVAPEIFGAIAPELMGSLGAGTIGALSGAVTEAGIAGHGGLETLGLGALGGYGGSAIAGGLGFTPDVAAGVGTSAGDVGATSLGYTSLAPDTTAATSGAATLGGGAAPTSLLPTSDIASTIAATPTGGMAGGGGLGGLDVGGGWGGTQAASTLGQTAGSAASAGAAGVGGGGGGVVGNILGDIKGGISSLGGMGTLLPAAGLLYAMSRSQALPQQGNISGLAGEATATGQQLIQQGQGLIKPMTTGVLPASAQAQIDTAVQSAKAATRSEYANMGLSGSTMEGTALSNIDQSAIQERYNVAQQMATTGLSEISAGGGQTVQAAQLYQTLMQGQLGQDQFMGNAISNFSAALAGNAARQNMQQPQ
ncbi:hypothetical protein KGP36_07695 [Patescibacteria group bacterium]|nr:hypothetical protein [Patescibacteria group bacterium]